MEQFCLGARIRGLCGVVCLKGAVFDRGVELCAVDQLYPNVGVLIVGIFFSGKLASRLSVAVRLSTTARKDPFSASRRRCCDAVFWVCDAQVSSAPKDHGALFVLCALQKMKGLERGIIRFRCGSGGLPGSHISEFAHLSQRICQLVSA